MNADNLYIALSAAVPLHIMILQVRGGPTDVDLQVAREASCLLGEKGDLLMFRGGKRGETARVFNALAKSLAVLAFCPGGVTLFGQHWEATRDEDTL